MEFKEYVKSIPKEERDILKKSIAKSTGRSESAVKSWANGNRGVPPRFWMDIEKATNKKVTHMDFLNNSIAA